MYYRFNLLPNRSEIRPIHPVRFLNAKTKKPVSIDVLSDTGSPLTTLQRNLAPSLGVDIGTAVLPETKLWVQIGNLKPVITTLRFSNTSINIIGKELLNNYKVTYRFDSVVYEELTPIAKATAAFATMNNELAMNERSKRYRF